MLSQEIWKKSTGSKSKSIFAPVIFELGATSDLDPEEAFPAAGAMVLANQNNKLAIPKRAPNKDLQLPSPR
jgi:hypothetical protein